MASAKRRCEAILFYILDEPSGLCAADDKCSRIKFKYWANGDQSRWWCQAGCWWKENIISSKGDGLGSE